MGAKWDFYRGLARTSLDVIALHIVRKSFPETLTSLALEINRNLSYLPVISVDLCRPSSYAVDKNGRLFLKSVPWDRSMGRDEDRVVNRVEISQKMAQRIAKAAERQGFEVPPYVQYRANRSDGKLAEYAQTAAKYAAVALSWYVIGSSALAHFIDFSSVQPITNSCKPAVSPDQKNALCYEWNKTEQAASVWKRRPVALSQRMPFYVPPFSYEKVQNIPYSDVPKYPEAIDALTAYAGKAGCPTASSQKLRQTFEGISQLPLTPEVKQAATVRVVEQIVQTPKNACSML